MFMGYCINDKYKNELIKKGFKLASKKKIDFNNVKCWFLVNDSENFDFSKLDKTKFFVSDKMCF